MEIKHSTLLVRRISTYTCAHVYVCVERVGAHLAVARRRHFFLFPLFIWDFQKSLGRKGCVVYVG